MIENPADAQRLPQSIHREAMMPLLEMTRAQLAVLWLWARFTSPDMRVHAVPPNVLDYPELLAVLVEAN